MYISCSTNNDLASIAGLEIQDSRLVLNAIAGKDRKAWSGFMRGIALPCVDNRTQPPCVREDAGIGQERAITRTTLRTPRAAALAGIIFSVLLISAFGLLRISVPADPLEPGAWLRNGARAVTLALNIIPFAGIAFLWFMGVLRDRFGQQEDRFFATVFLGSGLLFLAMLFAASALIGALILAFSAQPEALVNSVAFNFARAAVYGLVNIYMIKIAGVFMISTSTLAICTGFAPRWIALIGYGLALIILFGSYYIDWSFVVFPLWVLLVSSYILVVNFQQPTQDRTAIS